MAATVIERAETRNIERADGKVRGTRVFHVRDAASVDTVIALFGSSLPAKGDLFPSSSLTAYAKDYRIRPVDANPNQYEVEWSYASAVNAGGSTVAPNEVGYVDVQSRGTAEFVDVWRAFDPRALATRIAAIAPSGNPLVSACPEVGLTGGDIAGLHIDASGAAMSALRYTQTLQVTEVVSTQPTVANLRNARGTRNRTVFGGGAVGSVLYTGFSIASVTTGAWRITHEFVESTDYHLLQFACKTSLNEVVLDANRTAKCVLWRQPFLGLTNFYDLSANFAGRI